MSFERLMHLSGAFWTPGPETCVLGIHRTGDDDHGGLFPCSNKWAIRLFQLSDGVRWWFLYLFWDPRCRRDITVWTTERWPLVRDFTDSLELRPGYSGYQSWQRAIDAASRGSEGITADREWVAYMIASLYKNGWISERVNTEAHHDLGYRER